jgi:DNA polymerase-4
MKMETGGAYPVSGRVILHVDMNAFYASVHEAEEPEKYRGKPLAVAGSVELRRGIIVTSSYAARARGVKTGMQVRKALKLCPDLILLEPDFELYRMYSRRFLAIAESYTPLVEATSIDECYMDITGSKSLGTPLDIARSLMQRIRTELTLPCSVGIAPNKLLAKMASDMKKPNGLTVLRLRDVERVLWPKPCGELFGIGKQTSAKLAAMGIRTIGQLATADEELLVRKFGVYGRWMKQAARGIDPSPVNPEREANKSIGHSTTLPRDYTDRGEIGKVFLNLADQVCRRLRRQKLIAHTVQIAIRDPDMKTITRSRTLEVPTDDMLDVHREAVRLFADNWPEGKPVRLLGISLSGLTEKERAPLQLDLFEYERRPVRDKLNETLDRLRDKYGENAVVTAGMLGDDPSVLLRDRRRRGTSLQMDHLAGRDDD